MTIFVLKKNIVMQSRLLVLILVLFPLLSFAQNGGVSFGVISTPTQAPNGGAAQPNTNTGKGTGSEADNTPDQQPAACTSAMGMNNFKSAKQTVAKANYEESKLAAAKAIMTSDCLSTEQVMQICKLFGFEQTKLDFAKFAYSKTTDRGNYSKVVSILTIAASKKSLTDFISNGGK